MRYCSIPLQYSVWTDAAKTHCRPTQHRTVSLGTVFSGPPNRCLTTNERRRTGWWILPRRGTMGSVSHLVSNCAYMRPIHRPRTRFFLYIILSPFATFLFYNNILSVFSRRNQTRSTRLSITIVNRRTSTGVSPSVVVYYFFIFILFFIFTRVAIDDHNTIIITTLCSRLLLLALIKYLSSVYLSTISY